MKFCSNCGSQISDNAYVCVNCGVTVENQTKAKSNELDLVIKVFLIVGTVVGALVGYLIPLIWCIPLTISCWKKLDNGEPISDGLKICILLFVNIISGIVLFCRKDK